ncbi:MAG: metalloregulator ArsR/SmtB family transcription factor [Caldilineaceae bacterium]
MSEALSEDQIQAERILDALGHQTRRDIIRLLREQPMPVGTLADHFPISRPAISKHLRILQSVGLVHYRVQGASNIFYLQPDAFQLLRHYLAQFWDDALANFQQAAARQAEAESETVESEDSSQ